MQFQLFFAAVGAAFLLAGCKPSGGGAYQSPQYASKPDPVTVQKPHQPETPPAPTLWWVRDINKSHCFVGDSPATKMREIQAWGSHAKATDIAGGGVEVGFDNHKGFEYWTYYPSEASCIASLPRSQSIPSRYQ